MSVFNMEAYQLQGLFDCNFPVNWEYLEGNARRLFKNVRVNVTEISISH
jgi:hypothetical protein